MASIDFSALISQFGTMENDLSAKVQATDGQDLSQADLLKLQNEVSKFQQLAGMVSGTISAAKQSAQGIIQKI